MYKLLILFMLCSSPLLADGVFQFNVGAGNIGSTDTFTNNGISLIVSGYSAPNVLANMFENARGPNETGLGLAGTVDNEISGNGFIQLNMTPFDTVPVHTISIGISVDSIQDSESYDIWGSDTAGVLGKLVFANQTVPTLTFEPAYQFYSVTASSGNVLLDGFSVATPEPSSALLLMLGASLLAFIALIARKCVQWPIGTYSRL